MVPRGHVDYSENTLPSLGKVLLTRARSTRAARRVSKTVSEALWSALPVRFQRTFATSRRSPALSCTKSWRIFARDGTCSIVDLKRG